VTVPIFPVLVERLNLQGTTWIPDDNPVFIEAEDHIAAGFGAVRRLGLRPKVDRLLLWEGPYGSGTPRIFHSGS
jgi:hypothetical protein